MLLISIFEAKNRSFVSILQKMGCIIGIMSTKKYITVTDFTPADERAVLDFCNEIFKEKGWPLEFMDSSISQAFNQTGDVFLVVKQNGTIIGCGGLKKLSDKETLLTRFYVSEQFRGVGLAQKIYDALTRKAQKLKYHYVVLDVAHDNPRAIRFYEKQGMEPFPPVPHPRWKESAPGEEKYVKYLRKVL